MNARNPAVAGTFYPGRKEDLKSLVETLLQSAKKAKITGKVKGLIVPHAGLACSGLTAAHAYRLLPENTKRIVMLGVSHHVGFDGIAYSPNDCWETPLGSVKVAAPKFGFASEEAHAREHCLEVQLPFLQNVLKEFEIVPMLTCFADPEKTAEELEKESFFIFSTDLSHYLPYEKAKATDERTIRNVLAFKFDGIGREDACGSVALLAAMHLAKKNGWKIKLLDYRNSGDTCSGKESVVGYGAFALVGRA